MQYGKPDATDEMIWEALEIAQAKDFVSEMEDGLDSHVEQEEEKLLRRTKTASSNCTGISQNSRHLCV